MRAGRDSMNSRNEAAQFLERCERSLTSAFQPIFSASDGAMHGVEALTRGVQGLGARDPHELFNRADELCVIASLEIRQVQKAIHKLDEIGVPSDVHLFANLDERVICDDWSGLRASVLDLQQQTDRPVVLEISEQRTREREGLVTQELRWLAENGFKIAIDDFGVGVSDLQAMHLFDSTYIKVDRYFVDGIGKDPKKRVLVKSVIDLAHLLGKRVVAEGVEHVDDLNVLRNLHCDFFQGFLLAKPLQPQQVIQVGSAPLLPAEQTSASADRRRPLDPFLARIRTFDIDDRLIDVAEAFQDGSAPTYFPVVGRNRDPIGIITERNMRKFLYRPFGIDLLRNKACGPSVRSLVEPCPIADRNVDIDQLVDLVAGEDVPGVMLTCAQQYHGFIPTRGLLELANSRRVEMALDQNPLTRLPGNRAILSFIKQSLGCTSEHRCYCYFDFDNFKPFNDVYGFRVGDRAIILFSHLLRTSFEEASAQLGHIGGDDFFVGQVGQDIETFAGLVDDTLSDFHSQIKSFYSDVDRAAGGIRALDRGGAEKFFPLMRCSAALLIIEAGEAVADAENLPGHFSDLKRRAKASDSGLALRRLCREDVLDASIAAA